jgi:hypothetical protein
MAAGYVSSLIDELGAARISELIPYGYIAGKNHGRREGTGTVYDQRIDAAGLEWQLEELKGRFYRYVAERRHDHLALEFDQESRKVVYLFDQSRPDDFDQSRPDDPHMDFIFTDKTALKAVRFRQFMADCRALAGDSRALDLITEREKSAILAFLHEAHRDIMENFDPKVVKLRKKNKIIVADGALDALFQASDD